MFVTTRGPDDRASPRSFALVLYLFSHSASYAVVATTTSLQIPNLGGGISNPVTSGLQVLPVGQESVSLSASTDTFTTISSVPTTISGVATFVPTTIISTGLTFAPVPTGQPATSRTTSSKPAAAVAGGVIGAVLLLIGALGLFLRRRRRQSNARSESPSRDAEQSIPNDARFESPSKDAEQSMPSTQETSVEDPFADVHRESWASYIDRIQSREHGLTTSNTISTRQLYISNQVHRARKQVAELEEMSSLLLRSSIASSAPEYSSRLGSGICEAAVDEQANVDDANHSEALEVRDKLEQALQQIEGLRNRIQELEMQRRSSWALGLSDVPPPGYSE